MLSLLKNLGANWEQSRDGLYKDLESIETVLNRHWAITFGTDNILGVPAGGTGDSILTDHGVLIGQGTDPIITVTGTTNTVLHGNTGADPSFSTVVEADITLSDVTTDDVTTARHGFAPKAPNAAYMYLDGKGRYSIPPTAPGRRGQDGDEGRRGFPASGLSVSGGTTAGPIGPQGYTIRGRDAEDGSSAGRGALTLHNNVLGNTIFTKGSVIFAGDSGRLIENNAEFFWDNSAKTLKINGSGTVTTSIQCGTGSNRFSLVTGTVSTNLDAASLITIFSSAGLAVNASGIVTVNNATGSARFRALGAANEHVARFVGDPTSGQSFGVRVNAGTTSADNGFRVISQDDSTDYFFVRGDGNVGIGLAGVGVTAKLHIKAGTASASTAPLKFTSGTVLSSAEAGAIEFTTDDFFATITTGAARKAFVLDDGSRLTSGKIPVATTNGRLINLTASSAYTPTNVTTDRSYDANATTIDELADIVGTMIADLQTKGILG